MPIYEFVCESCGNEFEQIQSFSESRMPVCSQCGSTNVGRRMSRPAIHFKGSGWYITDSKKSSDNKGGNGTNGDSKHSSDSAKESGKESGKSDSSGESKSETKVESSTETKSAASTESKAAPTSAASD